MIINKNGKCSSKIGIILNVLLHYGKYKKIVGTQIRIVKNNGMKKYDKYVGEYGWVTDFEFTNFDKPIIVMFKDKSEYCFSLKEITTNLFKGDSNE